MTIKGAGFLAGSTTVIIDGTAATSVNVVSLTTLTAVSPPHAAEAVDVAVTTTGGTATLAGGFTYHDPPTVSSGSGPADGGQVTISGTGFVAGNTTVVIDGVAATAGLNVINSTSLTVSTPARAAGVANVVVTTPGGTATLLGGLIYYVAPTIASISPSTGLTSGGTRVTITGTGFVAGSTTVTIDGVAATSVNVLSFTSLTATTPAHIAGTTNVFVRTPGGTAALASLRFTYTIATELAITKGTQEDQIAVSWTAVSDAVSYNVYRASCPTCENELIATNVVGTQVVYVDTTAEEGVAYTYSLQIKNASGQLSDLLDAGSGCTQPPATLSLTNKTFTAPIMYGATNSIVAGGNVTVASGGRVTFLRSANGSIILKSGFTVQGGNTTLFQILVSAAPGSRS